MMYLIVNNIDHSMAQTESLGSILRYIEEEIVYYHISDLVLFATDKKDIEFGDIINNGQILDIGYQLAMYHIFISVIRQTAKGYNIFHKDNTKQTLVYLRQKFQTYYI